MHRTDQVLLTARAVQDAALALLEASERCSDLQRFKISTQLLDLALQLGDLHKQLLELDGKPLRFAGPTLQQPAA